MKHSLAPADAKALEFSAHILRLQEAPPHPMGRKVLWLLLGLLLSLLCWALIGRLDIVAVAEGKLVPESYVQIVQPSDSGIVKEILVKEGERVNAGQVLMRMDMQISEADTRAIEAEYQRKKLTLRRIEAELNGRPFKAEKTDPSELAQEIGAQYQANKLAVEAELAEERSRLVKARQELSAAEQVKRKLEETLPHYRSQDQAYEQLVKDGYAGALMGSDKRRERVEKEQELQTQVFVIESARASILQSEKKLAQIESDDRRQLHAEHNEVRGQFERLAQELAKQTHKQSLLELRAPQGGVVKDLATHTAGTVVQPGTVLLTLVPDDKLLRAEVWISNEDVGFVRPGQSVKLKFASFPFQKYGMAEGVLEHISADAADAREPAQIDKSSANHQPLVYKALVRLKEGMLRMDGESFPLSAGMQTNAEVLLGSRTVAEYLLSPVQKAWHEAARER